MAISYHVYANDGRGGAIDYSTPVATVPAAQATPVGTFLTAPLAAPSDNLFAIRAFDDVSGVEEANTDARVHVVIDVQGRDVSGQPNAAIGLVARWTIGDVSLVSWGYAPAGQGGAPAQFNVTATPTDAGSVVANPPMVAVAFVPGVAGYGCRLEGLSAASAWTIQVQAVGGSDWVVGPPARFRLARQSGLLTAVDSLVATASA